MAKNDPALTNLYQLQLEGGGGGSGYGISNRSFKASNGNIKALESDSNIASKPTIDFGFFPLLILLCIIFACSVL